MSRFENTMGIDELKFYPIIKRICPIGKSICTYQITIEMEPGNVIPDYIEMDEFIGNLSNVPGTLEMTVKEVFEYIWNNYTPKELLVRVFCEDAKHSPATVSKHVVRDTNNFEGEY